MEGSETPPRVVSKRCLRGWQACGLAQAVRQVEGPRRWEELAEVAMEAQSHRWVATSDSLENLCPLGRMANSSARAPEPGQGRRRRDGGQMPRGKEARSRP